MVEALLTLRGGTPAGIGRDRIRLLEAVGRAGSISGGAKAVGMTYKAAWQALDAMAGLFDRPVLETRIGGRTGGGARLTPAGERLVAQFGRLEAALAEAALRLGEVVAGEPAAAAPAPLLRTSARNALRGRVEAVRTDGLTAAVAVALPEGGRILAQVTGESLRGLRLSAGRQVTALIKASFIDLAPLGPTDDDRPEANRFEATVRRCAVVGADAEAVLDIGHGRMLAAASTARRVRELALEPGRPVLARFGAGQVILAVSGDME